MYAYPGKQALHNEKTEMLIASEDDSTDQLDYIYGAYSTDWHEYPRLVDVVTRHSAFKWILTSVLFWLRFELFK